MRRSAQHQIDGPRPRVALVTTAYALTSLLWIACAIASFLPEARLWGINHLAFYPWPLRAAALAAMAVSFLPPSRRAVLGWLADFSALLGRRRWLVAAALAVVAFVVFNILASSTQLLGDGLYVGNNVERAAKADSGTFAKVLRTPDLIYPGTEMLYLSVSRVVSSDLGIPPLVVLRFMIALFGALLVFVVAASHPPSRSASQSRPAEMLDGTAFVLLAFLSGTVQIFFGYVEVYAPLVCFAALFLLAARQTFEGRAGLWVPVIFALAALGMHRLGLVLLPALGVLVLWVACRRQKSKRFIQGTIALAAVTIAVPPIAVAVGGLGGLILPLLPGDRAYAVLSSGHLVDVLNEILLVFPGFFVLGTLAVLLAWERVFPRRSVEGAGSGVRPRGDGDGSTFPALLFGFFLGVPAFVFLLFFKPELGMARDWDLFAITALGFWAPVSAALARARSDLRARAVVDAVLPPVLVMATVLTAAWVGVNAHAGRSVARFESILEYDRTRAAYAYETLASYHRERKDYPAEIGALENAVAAGQNPRLLLTLGLRYDAAGEREKAVSTLNTCLVIKPDYAEARKALLQILLYMGRDGDILPVCEEGARIEPEDFYYPLFEGMAHARRGRVSDARAALERCLGLKPAPEVAAEVEMILRSLPPETGEVRPTDEEEESAR